MLVLAGWVAFSPVPAELQNSTWALQAIQTADGQVLFTWTSPRSFNITFAIDGTVSGRAACNLFNGRIYSIRFTKRLWAYRNSFFLTLMNCPPIDPSQKNASAAEHTYLNNLMSSTSYTLQSDELRIRFGRDNEVMIFRSSSLK
jgi:heat shock protein HslJ